jgi:ParB family transcriptional regulator, chromosome partitioning protein
MARRKRLTLLGSDLPDAESGTLPPLETKAMSFTAPPIARVAAEASATAALGDLAAAWQAARDSGRLIQDLPLDSIDEGWLVRDRIALDTDEMADLIASIRERGQQVPIEVVALDGGRYGLISGWRRLRALKVLQSDPGRRDPATVLALLRRPAGAAEAYRAMVEENEIRANLSYYERARIAARAAEAGAFPDARAAITALFAAGSRAKRSKIGSFLTLVDALDDRLRFAWAIPERLGMRLAQALDADPTLRTRLYDRLRKANPDSAETELALLTRTLPTEQRPLSRHPALPGPDPQPPRNPVRALGVDHEDRPGHGIQSDPAARIAPSRQEVVPGLWLETEEGTGTTRATLSGTRLDSVLLTRLVGWLKTDG